MTWTEWIPAISTSSLLAAIAFLVGTYYKAKVEKGVQHNLDQKLEELRAKLRRDEEGFKADLRARDDQIAALRSGALSGMASRQAALDKRRLDAIEKLWSHVIDRWQSKLLARMAAPIKMEVAIDAAAQQNEEGRKIREFAEVIWNTAGIIDNTEPRDWIDKERPFLSPIVWAIFSAYRHVLALPIAQITVMRTGVGRKMLADPKGILEMVKSALPHQANYIDKYGTTGLPYLIEELEEKLLSEIVISLESTTSDAKSVEQAAVILEAVDKVVASTVPQIVLPADLGGLRA